MRELALDNRYVKEALIIAAGTLAYTAMRFTLLTDVAPRSFVNAQRMIDVERKMNVFIEPAIQGWLIENAYGFVLAANWFYTLGFLCVLMGVIFYWLRFKPSVYLQCRRVFLATLVFTWLLSIVFPLAPPRLLEDEGFVDTVAEFGPKSYTSVYASKEAVGLYNPYSAMPSMHFGCVMLFTIWFFRSGDRRMAIVGVLWSFLTLVAIIVTANHYLLDPIVGAIVVVLSFPISRWFINTFNSGQPKRRSQSAP